MFVFRKYTINENTNLTFEIETYVLKMTTLNRFIPFQELNK